MLLLINIQQHTCACIAIHVLQYREVSTYSVPRVLIIAILQYYCIIYNIQVACASMLLQDGDVHASMDVHGQSAVMSCHFCWDTKVWMSLDGFALVFK